jgi:hypothetical protein
MTRLASDSAIIRMASELGLDWRSNPVVEITDYCVQKITRWLKGGRPVRTLADVEARICEKLQLVIEEVWTDDDLDRVIRKYVGLGEGVFASLRHDFDETTYGACLERRKVTGDACDRYVAVIDCRGGKAHRRFYTKWHEIAHLLTMTRQLELPFHRSTDRCPVERLMDKIAGEIGFFDPIFRPAVEKTVRQAGKLTFEVVERIRQRHCPDASFQAALIACAKRAPVPAIYVEAGMGYKRDEEARLRSNQLELITLEPPKPLLRARVAVPNDLVSGSGLRIDRNMQVPENSVIHSVSSTCEGSDATFDTDAVESLRDWKHSDGEPVGEIVVRVEARRVPGKVIALVTIA